MTTNKSKVPAGVPVLEAQHVSKRFSTVLANDDISIRLYRGEILSLLGENGAGKSTLMNVLFGLYKPTSGRLLIDGNQVEFHSPKDAIRLGLGMVHQHFMLVETLSATENIILGSEPGSGGIVDYRRAKQEVSDLSKRYGLVIDPDAKIENLSVGIQQRVEILKMLYRQAKVLILDEPTAVLTPQEVTELFNVIGRLRDGGVSVIIITHKLEEVKEISDRAYILRRGKLVGECKTADVTKAELATMMVGREVVLTVHKKPKTIESETIFSIRNLVVKDDRGLTALRGLSLDVRPGEITGIAGIDGNGQTELAEIIMGLRPIEEGVIEYRGKNISRLSTRRRIGDNISNVCSDRQRYGLVLPMSISENIVIGYHDRPEFSQWIHLRHQAFRDIAITLRDSFDIRASSVDMPVANLSGGNQQKVILAREFSRQPHFLLISQPTRGLDVGAIEYIHSQILEMRDQNVAILLISLELEEIFSLSDRILVLYEGEINYETTPEASDEYTVGIAMTGGRVEDKQEVVHV